MKKMLTAAIALLTSAAAFAQIPIAYYDFENNTTRTTFENAVEQQINSGSTSITHSNLSTPAGFSGAGGYNGNIFASGMALLEYQFSTSTTDPGLTTTKYIQFTTNVSGFTGISISMNTFTPSFLLGVTQGPTKLGINFSTDGTNFTNIAPVSLTRGITWETKTLNFPASANGASSLIVRIYAYGADGSDGGLLIDNLNVLATGTSAGKVFTSLNEDNLYTSNNIGCNRRLSRQRKFFC